jgi:signal transduction histidine kinase/ActR/RegA family two-component response regulator
MMQPEDQGVPPAVRRRAGAAEIRDAIYAISEASSTVADLDALYARIHQIVATLMPARNFYIALLDDTGSRVAMPYFVDERDTTPSPGFRAMGNGLTEYIIRSRRPYFFGPGEQQEYNAQGAFDILGQESIVWMGAPLIIEDTCIGMLATQSYSEGESYTTADLEVLSYVSRQVASAIHRKRTEALLQESTRRLDTLVNSLPGIVFRRRNDDAMTMEYMTKGAEELTGHGREEFVANRDLSFGSIVEADDKAPLLATIRDALGEHRPYSVSYRIRSARRGVRWVFERGSGVWIAGQVVALEGFMTDDTEAHEAEAERESLAEQLRQAQKMESVGLLAGGVAHDLNNLLMPILGYADVLRETVGKGSAEHEMLDHVTEAAGRARDLVRKLLAFSRRQVLALRTVDLVEVLRGFRGILRSTIREEIAIELLLPDRPVPVRADPVQIEQVILNLAVNAQDAMATTAARPVFRVAVDATPSAARMVVTDNGAGMSAEALSHVFEPFFTTKPAGKGTGLGLSTAYGIVTQHGGTITVDSGTGRGTEFVITLPRAQGEAAPAVPASDAAPSARGSETVLLVEDEEVVRRLSSVTLQRLGYKVIACAGGEEALTAARRHEGGIDILVTDVIMGGMNGRDLAVALLQERPGLPVLFTSGYTDDVIARHDVLEPGTHFMPKPYTPRELAARIRAVLRKAT